MWKDWKIAAAPQSKEFAALAPSAKFCCLLASSSEFLGLYARVDVWPFAHEQRGTTGGWYE